MADDAIAYAKEVYAACLTVGFVSPSVTRLKTLLDDVGVLDLDAILDTAQKAQSEAVHWAGHPDRAG